MKLKEFVDTFVCRNTLIRLWKPAKGGYKMIYNGDKSVCMEWELLRDEVWQSKYNDYKVIGIKDIVVDDFYREAVNI
ncbi:MAG: hypothetical protein E7E92_08835, partial [Clostridiales bacterium]|nr:hypothetical protein [Clostridiales bacterium]